MTAVLSLDRIKKTFWRGTELTVLRDASLELHAGTLTGVQGERSTGKTTLLRIAAGIEVPDTGRLLLDGVDIATLGRRQRRTALRQIAVVDREEPPLSDLSVLDIVALPLHRTMTSAAALRQAGRALERAGIGETANARWSDLSDTSRSLVAIVQGLATDPRVLLVDDPTPGAMHVTDSERIMSLLRTAARERDCAILMAVPDFSGILGHVDTLCGLSGGHLTVSSARPRAGDDPGGQVVKFPDTRSA